MKIVPAGTLLVSFKLTLGRLAYAGRDLFTNEAIAALVIKKPTAIDQRFLYWALTAFDWQAAAAGSEKLKGKTLNTAKLKAIPIALPPIYEQQRIVAILDKAFEDAAIISRKIEANLADSKTLFRSFVLDRLETLGPKHALRNHVHAIFGYAFKSDCYTSDSNGIRLIRGDNIMQGHFRWDGVKRWPAADRATYRKCELRANDVLVAMDRTWVQAGIKFAIISEDDLPALLVQRVACLRCRDTLHPEFLAYTIGSILFERYVLEIQTGLGVPHISGDQLKAFSLAVPPAPVQKEFIREAKCFKRASERLVEYYSRALRDLAEMKSSLLLRAFAGELT